MARNSVEVTSAPRVLAGDIHPTPVTLLPLPYPAQRCFTYEICMESFNFVALLFSNGIDCSTKITHIHVQVRIYLPMYIHVCTD